MTKKKKFGLVAGIVVICILSVIVFKKGNRTPSPSEDAYEMLGRIEAALGDEYKKQSMTELVATIQYGDNDGNTINYYILKTTYYEADPAEITGLNTEAIMLIVGPGTADICQEMKIQDWTLPFMKEGNYPTCAGYIRRR